MRHNYFIKKINSPFEDTSFFVRNIYKKQAFLLDCGRLSGLTNTEILSLSDVFISHTHIDHFYGFDRILRTFLRSDKKLRLFGPKGIINNVRGKLAGYTWNLVDNYSFELEVVELSTDEINTFANFKAANRFEPEYATYDTTIELGDGFRLDYTFFDHDIFSTGYRIKEGVHVNIKKDVFDEFGYIRGPWLSELKAHLRCSRDLNKNITVTTSSGEKDIPAGQLKNEIVIFKPPQDITFITDFAPTFENYMKAINFAKDSYILLIEGMFLKEDILHSIDKKHTSLDLSKRIFIESSSKYVHFFHFSSKYEKKKELFLNELYRGIGEYII